MAVQKTQPSNSGLNPTTLAILVGGFVLGVYFAHSYRFYPGIQYYPQKLQAALLNISQLTANCITQIGEPETSREALDIFNCYSIKDETFNINEPFICDRLNQLFRSISLLVHPDKTRQDKELFQNAIQILRTAKQMIHQLLCTEEGKIAQCVRDARKEILSCGEGKIPRTCANLEKYIIDLATIVQRTFPTRPDLIEKIRYATHAYTTKAPCFPIPASIANFFGNFI